ncbi:hypothetical protein FTX61_03665 [Nitriliruptoraceae bacterium ZYF776]|nr:hypothetical protein [Profundirhabdus halotolerans]
MTEGSVPTRWQRLRNVGLATAATSIVLLGAIWLVAELTGNAIPDPVVAALGSTLVIGVGFTVVGSLRRRG